MARIIFLLASLLCSAVAARPMEVRYLKTPVDAIRYQYQYDLINAAMKITDSSFGPHTLLPFTTQMSSARVNQEAILGEKINLHWSDAGHAELDNGMIPIPIPLLKGLHGYRLFLINKQDQALLSKITPIEQLRTLTIGQGANWGDIKIFEANQFTVVTTSRYEALFGMLVRNRFDLFSRSILEAPVEYEAIKYQFPQLSIDEHLMLYYPFPVFFYVSKNAPELALRLQTGLEMMISDGSFDQLFNRHFQHLIDKAKPQQRVLFRLNNPFVPEFVPLEQNELWIDLPVKAQSLN